MAEGVDLLFYRGIERWMVVVGGLIYAYLGYRLFLYGVDQGNGKLEAENQFFKFTFSGSGPGLFFMAFGGMILISSVYSTTNWSRKQTTDEALGAQAQTHGGTRPSITVEETIEFSGSIGAHECNFIKLANNDNDPRKAAKAYGTSEDPRLITIGDALGKLDDDDLAAVLPVMEVLICK